MAKKSEPRTTPIQFRLEQEIIDGLDEIARGGNRADALRSLVRSGLKTETWLAPHFGDVPCGPGQVLLDQPPAVHLDVSAYLRGPDRFLLTAKGLSMKERGILDGDTLVIRRADAAEHGNIVVASIDGAVTLKRLEVRKGVYYLVPASSDDTHKPMHCGDTARIIGVLVGVIRKV